MIILKHIKKVYKGGGTPFEALKDVSMTIKEGEFITIVGRSGSGKSTLLNIIGLLDDFDEGEYILDGDMISRKKINELSKLRLSSFGFVFQSFHLLNHLTARENVEIPLGYSGVEASVRKARAMEMLEKVGLGDKLYNRPAQLSGGEQQRVAIARALVNSPKILLADEPTGNLDSKTSHSIMKLLKELSQEGITIILVTHDQNIIKNASNIVRIHDGQLCF